jgi:adenylosuccinate lyase
MSLTKISPVDGRYAGKTRELNNYFSEYALIRYRVFVEIRYFQAMMQLNITPLSDSLKSSLSELDTIIDNFDLADAEKVKQFEMSCNHDVKAVEYFVKEKLHSLGLESISEFVHFGLTSQDINNTAFPLMIKDAVQKVVQPALETTLNSLKDLATRWKDIPMLARTHGQPASPTSLGKEFNVFVARLEKQFKQLEQHEWEGKFGGATGNFNAHLIAYPNIDWKEFADGFISSIGLNRQHPTTQIDHYDHIASLCHIFSRINTILIDLCRDIWTYISMDYFRQKVIAGEVGSSAMPHKVNPIDFENGEGNLGFANAMFGFLADKLPISRLQRDLTDSTVLRNIGMPFAHTLISLSSIQKGLSKLKLNKEKIEADLDNNWAVVAEAIQTILRREGYPKPYEALKAFTRGKPALRKEDIREFIESLDTSEQIKAELRVITPFNYIGYQ